MKVRMLRAAATKFGVLKAGQAIEVPAFTAESWIGAGLAEQDKMIESAPEIK